MFQALLLAAGLPFLLALLIRLPEIIRQVSDTDARAKRMAALWALMYLTYALWFERGGGVEGVTSLDASAGMQIAGMIIASLAVLIMLIRGASLHPLMKGAAGFLFLYGVVGVSTAGLSPAAVLTLYKASLVLLDALLVVVTISYLSEKSDPALLFKVGVAMLALFVLGATIGAVIWPERAFWAVRGIIGQVLRGTLPIIGANELGFICAVTAIVGTSRFFNSSGFKSRYYWGAMVWMAMLALFLNQSRTSIVGVLLGFLVLGLANRSMQWVARGVGFALVAVLIYYAMSSGPIGFEDTTEQYLRRGVSDEELESLSGRIGLWNAGWEMFKASPLFGHGFEAGVKYAGQAYGVPGGTHMHNAHMQILVNSGLIGYMFWFLTIATVSVKMYSRLWRNHWKRDDEISKIHVEISAVLALILLKTMTGSVLVYHQYSLLLLMGIMVYLARSGAANISAVLETAAGCVNPSEAAQPAVEKRILSRKKSSGLVNRP